MLPQTGRGKEGAAELCAEAGRDRSYITHDLLPSIAALGDDDVPFERSERKNAGVATKLSTYVRLYPLRLPTRLEARRRPGWTARVLLKFHA